MRHAYRKDRAQGPIGDALRSIGASVESIDVSRGLPDLLVGFRGETFLLEVKTAKDKVNRKHPELRPSQVAFMARWRGRPPVVVNTPEEAVAAVLGRGWKIHELEGDE